MFISCLKFKDIKEKNLDAVLGIPTGFLEVSSNWGGGVRGTAWLSQPSLREALIF